jgi:hypothetical protein
MNTLRVSITAFADGGVPGWVECEMRDAEGDLHQFVEKVPVVSNEDLRHDSGYPRDGFIACGVISSWKDDLGRDLSRIDTAQPWGVESKAGITEFVVLSNDINSAE